MFSGQKLNMLETVVPRACGIHVKQRQRHFQFNQQHHHSRIISVKVTLRCVFGKTMPSCGIFFELFCRFLSALYSSGENE